MANLLDPSLDSLFLELTKRRHQNLVPLCTPCGQKAERLDIAKAAPAMYMCITCWPNCILCSECESAHPFNYDNHKVIHLKDVCWNIYNAAVGLPFTPIVPSDGPTRLKAGSVYRPTTAKRMKTPRRGPQLQFQSQFQSKNKDSEIALELKDSSESTLELIRESKPRVLYPGQHLNTEFNWPYGMCVSPTGGILVADTYNHRVLVVNDGNAAHEFENIDEKRDRLMSPSSYPIGVCCSQVSSDTRDPGNAKVAIAESGNGLVQIYNSEGNSIQKIHETLHRPHGVKFDSDWYVLITDISNRTVTKHSCLDGRIVQTFSEPNRRGTTESPLQKPSYLECSDDGKMIFVSDTAGRSVKIFDNDTGGVVKTVGPFDSPHGLCLDPDQRTLIVADFRRSTVEMVDLRKGTVVSEVAGVNEGLIGPTDVAYHSPSRHVLVLDTTRSNVLQFPMRPLPISDISEFGLSTDPWQDETRWLERPAPNILIARGHAAAC